MEKQANFICTFEIRSNRTMNHGEKLGKLIHLERRLENKSTESLNLDQDSQRNHQVNKREIFKIINRKNQN